MGNKGFVDTTNNNIYYSGSKKKKKAKKDPLAFNRTNPYTPFQTTATAGYAADPTISPTLLKAYADYMNGTPPGTVYGKKFTDATGKGVGSVTNDRMYSGSGGGSGGGGKGGGSGDLFDDWTGFAEDYTGVGADILYDDPRILVRDTLKQMGYNPNDGLMDLLGDKAGDLQYLAMLGLGAGPDSANSQTTENYINFANEWAKNMTTPGAGMPDYNQMIQSILDAPEGSAIKAALEGGTPQEQAAMLNNLVQVASGSMTPLMQRALGRVMQDRTDDWLSSKAKGGRDPLANWLQKGGRGITG